MKTAIAKILSGQGTCKDVLKCLFGLGEFEMSVYKRLYELGPSRADELAPKVNKDKSTVYRALQKLVAAGLVVKQSKTLRRGGHYHTYTAVPPETVSETLKICVDRWFASIQASAQKFDIL